MLPTSLRSVPYASPLVGLAISLIVGVAACNGCRSTPRPDSTSPGAPSREGTPTVRIYALSNLAGALEPCGCTKDQLGGIDHLAAFLARDRSAARGSLFLAVGPTMFLDPKLEEARSTQDRWKAEAISASLGDIGLSAWTPGYNDWAGGAPLLATLAKSAQGPLVAANLDAVEGAVKAVVREIGGIKVGVVGVSVPYAAGAPPTGVEVKDAAAALTAAVAEARSQGAKILIGMAALPRGEALRLAERVPDLSALLVGKPVDAGEANDAPPAPVLIGNVLVVQTSNHLQTVGVVDFFVQGNDYKFQDATGLANAEALASLNKRIHDYEGRLAAWEKDPSLRPEDLTARRADLKKMRDEQARLTHREVPKSGSFFRYALVEVREKLGRDAKVEQRMSSFYKRVNDHNKTAFAGRKPPPISAGRSGYTGIEVCSDCHMEERRVWNLTGHARAYVTLSKQFKEYNLDCVSCHVTGYEKPGGSTVTVNDKLRDVQCEECHGPGAAHAKSPAAKGLIDASPPLGMCVSACHHPPHVDDFDAAEAKRFILGPGHGMPDNAPWPAWARDGGAH